MNKKNLSGLVLLMLGLGVVASGCQSAPTDTDQPKQPTKPTSQEKGGIAPPPPLEK